MSLLSSSFESQHERYQPFIIFYCLLEFYVSQFVLEQATCSSQGVHWKVEQPSFEGPHAADYTFETKVRTTTLTTPTQSEAHTQA